MQRVVGVIRRLRNENRLFVFGRLDSGWEDLRSRGFVVRPCLFDDILLLPYPRRLVCRFAREAFLKKSCLQCSKFSMVSGPDRMGLSKGDGGSLNATLTRIIMKFPAQ